MYSFLLSTVSLHHACQMLRLKINMINNVNVVCDDICGFVLPLESVTTSFPK